MNTDLWKAVNNEYLQVVFDECQNTTGDFLSPHYLVNNVKESNRGLNFKKLSL